jgi:hypothetical protein
VTNRAERRHPPKTPPHRTYTLELTGELEGFRVVMGAMTGSDVIALRSGQLTEEDGLRLTAARVVEHDFDVENVLDLDFWILTEILKAWGRAMEDAALPPPSGER